MISTAQLHRQAPREDLRRAFPGYGTAFLPSLILAVSELARDGIYRAAVEDVDRTMDAPASWKGSLNLMNWVRRALGGGAGGMERERENGASEDTASSGAFGGGAEECAPGHPLDEEGLYGECARRLVWIATPEVMCRFTGHRGKVGGRRHEGVGYDLEQAAGKFVGLTSLVYPRTGICEDVGWRLRRACVTGTRVLCARLGDSLLSLCPNVYRQHENAFHAAVKL